LITGTINAVDYNHKSLVQGGFVSFSGSIQAVDVPHKVYAKAGGAKITGEVEALDYEHLFFITGGDIRIGEITAVDKTDVLNFSAIVIDSSKEISGDSTFIKNDLIGSNDLTLNLRETVYNDGTYLGTRPFDPNWVNYSIWFLNTPDESSAILQDNPWRYATQQSVGNYYANMNAPDPGRYEIRWKYQKDQSSYAKEIVEPFVVISDGLAPEPDYT